MDDLISRQAAVSVIAKWMLEYGGEGEERERNALKQAAEEIKGLPSLQPEIVRCKECKYWKDSDGVYRRGFDAESKCPLNLKKVYEGTFYCGMAERRTDDLQ